MILQRMGKYALQALVILLALPLVLQAAQGPPPMGGMQGSPTINVKKFNADKELSRLTKKYKLTADQKAKISPVLADQEKRVHALGEDESLSDADWVASVRKVHRETVFAVKAMMTDDQASRYIADEEKQAKSDAEDDQMPNGPPPGGGGPPPGGGGGPPGE